MICTTRNPTVLFDMTISDPVEDHFVLRERFDQVARIVYRYCPFGTTNDSLSARTKLPRNLSGHALRE